FLRRYAQINHKVLSRQAIDAVLQMFDPTQEVRPLLGGRARRLMRQIRGDVTVGQNHAPLAEGLGKSRLRLEPVSRVKQRSKVRVHAFQRAEIAVQKLSDHSTEPGIVLRKADGMDRISPRGEFVFQQPDLRLLAAAVNAFECDQYARFGHSRSDERQKSLTGLARSRNAAHGTI